MQSSFTGLDARLAATESQPTSKCDHFARYALDMSCWTVQQTCSLKQLPPLCRAPHVASMTRHEAQQLTSAAPSTLLEWYRIMGPEYLLRLYSAFCLVASSIATICSKSRKLSSSVRAASAKISSWVSGRYSTFAAGRLGLT